MKFIFRSLLILLALYGLVFAIGNAYLSHLHAPLWIAAAFAVSFVLIQYIAAPWFIEWLMSIVWDDSDAALLPAANRQFVERLCSERHIRAPRIGIIYSGTPNAFSFGHTPANARVVVTQGLLDILTPDEVNAVLAHEIGHVEHWDFAVMAVAALASLVLYQIYAFTRTNHNSRPIAYTAYLAYLVSQFIVLLLNRTREYMADHYAAEVTGQPGVLSSALIKIACGLVRSDGEFAERKGRSRHDRKVAAREQRLSGALAVMGISNVQSGASLALGGANPADAAMVMRWDLVNPWARVYELNSTHPLTAFRVRALNEDAAAISQPTAYPLPIDQRIDWGRFPFEVLLWAIPVVTAWLLIIVVVLDRSWSFFGMELSSAVAAKLLIFTGAAWMLRTWYRYHGEFERATLGALIQDVTVSQMSARAVRVEGEIVGRGVPGVFWSPDLVLRDETGMLFILYRQSIPFARLLFALDADRFIGQRVVIEGWFRRGLRPYIEMSTLIPEDGSPRHARSRWVQYLLAIAACAAGYLWLTYQ